MRLAALSLLATTLCGQSLTEFRTVDPTGLPLSGAVVRLRHAATGQELRCNTNATGSCSLTPLQTGDHRIFASAADLSATLPLPPGPVVTIVLEPELLRTAVTIVSGSRIEELQDESPTKVDAITRAQIESTGYERVSDVLQELPGVLVRRGNTSTVGGEQIQGIDSRQVLVLQDGLPVPGARGIKSGVVNLNRQSSGRLGRIEVAKGTASSLYGSDAIGGVINMITQEPQSPWEGGLLLSGGSLGMLDSRVDLGARRDRFSFYLNGGTNRMDSYSLLPNAPTTVGPDTRRHDVLFKTRAQLLSNFSLGFTANAYRNRDVGRNASETGLVAGTAVDSTQSYALVADWTIDPSTVLQARAYTARYDENSVSTPIGRPGPPAPANLNEQLNRLDATLSRQVKNHLLQGGAEWAQTLYRGANRLAGDNVGQQVTARDFWIQDKWQILPRLTLTVGGRMTNHSLFGGAAVPRAGLVYRLTDSVLLRASFGMGFRAPDLGQLYFRFANPATFYQVIGNPNLNPEHSQSWQTGIALRRARYRLGVTLFRNNVRDLIDTRLIGTPRTAADLNQLLVSYGIPPFFDPLVNRQTFTYLNQSRIFTQGTELDGEYAFSRSFRVSGAYTFLHAKDTVTSLALPQRHRHTGIVRADYTVPKLGLHTNVRGAFYSHWLLNAATGTRGLPFQIWDAYVSKPWPRRVETFLAVDNLNNSRDAKLQLPVPSFDRPDYGRTVRAGLRYRFGKTE
jgi:outer membrane receptor for ferrienterochelin and colicins